MFEQGLPESTRQYLELLAKEKISIPFYLAGGTAIALHLGHRISVDLDYFSINHFDVHLLDSHLQDFETYFRDKLSDDTLLGAFGELRISFFWYRYPLLESPVIALGTQILQLSDLSAMKIEAIGQRNTKRDFIDLYFMAHQAGISLEKALEFHREKYAGLNISYSHLLLSLGYFDEADNDPMPQLLIPVEWYEVKQYFVQESRTLLQKYIE
jgi:hypothetical protein